MTLALRTGRTLSELMSSISAKEISLWMAFNQLHPIGLDVDRMMMANVAVTNLMPHTKPGKQLNIDDFMPATRYEKQVKQMNSEQIKAVMMLATGGNVKYNNGNNRKTSSKDNS